MPKVDPSKRKPPSGMSQERYERLLKEAQRPYKGLRKFVYGAVGASGMIGAFVFLTQLLAGKSPDTAIQNLAVQLGVVGLMIFLFRLESRKPKE